MSHRQFSQRFNVISVVLVLILFGTVCSSYAIDCMDLWDEESIAEMIDDDRRYEEKRKARQLEAGDHWDDDSDEDEYDDDDDEVHYDEHTFADHDDEDDEEDEGTHQGHTEAHATASESSTADKETRHRRQLEVTAEKRAGVVTAEEDPSADLEVAETHLFRPVFRYKSQYTERRRVRDNITPTRQ